MSLYPPLSTIPVSEHIIEKDGSKVISTGEAVKFGEMSFRMITDAPFDIEGFKLKENTYSPTTGIKINLDTLYHFEAKSTFRFTDETASRDADLTDLVVSSGEVNEENPEEANYKEYNLDPIFNKGINDYTLTLLEYLDTINITATQSDAKSTMKIKVPKHDSDGNLVYDSDGTTIIYEEKDISDTAPSEVTLNKLGEPDTEITIKVTAEDGVTENTYKVVIKRPYGTIEGKLSTYNADDIHIGTVKIYKAGDVSWEDYYISYNDVYTHDDLPTPIDSVQSEADGTFSIKVIPGMYDIMIDKACYFDYIIKNNQISENQTKNLNTIELIPGDINKDGMIDAKDFNNIKLYFGQDFQTADIDESGTIDAPDFNAVKLRFGQSIEIY